MHEDSTVAGFILGNMGKQTKADFVIMLVRRFEKHAAVKDHALHYVSLFNRLRENRNILEHAIPQTSWDRRYLGKISKLDKNSDLKAFEAPIRVLTELLASMRQAVPYSRIIRTAALHEDGGTGFAEVLASLDNPPLPHKISPLELEEAPIAGQRPPESFQT